MVIKEIVLLAGLGIMSVEDIRKKGIKRLWLIGLGIVGLIFTIADAEVLCVSFLLPLKGFHKVDQLFYAFIGHGIVNTCPHATNTAVAL